MQIRMLKKYNVGCVFETNEGYSIKILKIINTKRRLVSFLTDNPYEVEVDISSICKGTVRNLFHKRFLGMGYMGVGTYKAYYNGKESCSYISWSSMLTRCYSTNVLKNYENCKVCEDWLNYQNFAKWYEENFPYFIQDTKFELDKDLLQEGVFNKIYSPNTCLFLPKNVNKLISNKYENNTSGHVGVSFNKKDNMWMAYSKGKHFGSFKTKEECEAVVRKTKIEQDESVKDYLRSLNYLSEETIQLIKTV